MSGDIRMSNRRRWQRLPQCLNKKRLKVSLLRGIIRINSLVQASCAGLVA